MDGWLKGLVAAACIAILAGVGYYFYTEAQLAAGRSAQAERIEVIRRELFSFAKAEPHDVQRVRYYCAAVNSSGSQDRSEFQRQLISNCRALGYL